MGADGGSVGLHFFDHFGCEGFASAVDVIFVEVEGEGVFEFFEDGVGVGVDGFPAVIDGDEDGAIGDGFFTSFPVDEVLECDDVEAEVFDGLHLEAKFFVGEPHFGGGLVQGEFVVAEDGDAGGVFCWFFGRGGCGCAVFGRCVLGVETYGECEEGEDEVVDAFFHWYRADDTFADQFWKSVYKRKTTCRGGAVIFLILNGEGLYFQLYLTVECLVSDEQE